MFSGINIHSYKTETRDESIETLPIPNEVILYLSQNIGSPSKPVVKKGDIVKRGQIVAEPQGGCSSYIHASIGGKVKDITSLAEPGGQISEAIVIAKEGEQDIELLPVLEEITPESIRKRVLEAGIIGMGGAGFPAQIKLDPPKIIKTAFLNACECEPYLTADERLMSEEPQKVLEGFKLALLAVGAQKGVIGIEMDKEYSIERINSLISNEDNIELKGLPKKYPQGYEKMLITMITGKEIPSGGLPHDVASSVHNVGTAFAIYEAVKEGKPLIDRVLTLAGDSISQPANVKVPFGMCIDEILEYYEYTDLKSKLVIMGGPMMGIPMGSLHTGIMKTTSGVLFLKNRVEEEYPCVRCGKCVEVCPMSLVPQKLNKYCDTKELDKLEKDGISDCMECGCCTYSCPSKISLTHRFKSVKNLL